MDYLLENAFDSFTTLTSAMLACKADKTFNESTRITQRGLAAIQALTAAEDAFRELGYGAQSEGRGQDAAPALSICYKLHDMEEELREVDMPIDVICARLEAAAVDCMRLDEERGHQSVRKLRDGMNQ